MKKHLLILTLMLAGYSASAGKSDTLTYASGAEVRLDGEFLSATIDSLVNDATCRSAFPGCQILVARDGKLREGLFSYTKSEDYPIEVYKNMWGHKDLREKVYKAVADTKLREKKYRYSCMSFLCYPYVVESITGKGYEEFLRETFYDPIGADAIMLNPAHKYPMEKILQMLLNEGTYGGRRYLQKKTVREWTSCQYPENGNRRGLGFDSPHRQLSIPIARRLLSVPICFSEELGTLRIHGNDVLGGP